MAPSGQAERARANVAALRTLRTLQADGRPATSGEQEVLARWSGWGALPLVFDARPVRGAFSDGDAHERAVARWEALAEVRAQVYELLSEQEIAAARRNTLNAHYTDAALVRTVWDAVRALGFDGGRVLEPGSGSGNFLGFVPDDTSRPVAMTGVEVEPTTAAISGYLYPDADIVARGLEEVRLPDGAFDLAIGNVPFGRYTRFDEVHNRDLSLSIHDHFAVKSLAATRPGGLVAVITSRYTLDAVDSSARERMYELGDLVGAVRLPRQAHREAAGTDVVTDVLFLRRRVTRQKPGDSRWLYASERQLPGHESPVAVNDYYTAYPDHVLGELRTRIGQFGPELSVDGTGAGAAPALAEAAGGIVEQAHATGLAMLPSTAEETTAAPVVVQGMTDGALGLDEASNPTIVEGWSSVPLNVHPQQRDRLVALIQLKQQVGALYEAEVATTVSGETPELTQMRGELREAWRAYRRSNPPLTKPRQQRTVTPPEAKERAERESRKTVPEEWKVRTAFAWIEDDPEALLLFGLEEWDERAGQGVEQDVLHTRVLQPRQLPSTAQSPEDAVAVAMEWDGGRLDMARVANLLGVDEEDAAAQVGHAALAFRDPGQDGAWEPRHRYLSGNVRTKLSEAREAAGLDPSYAGNVAALEQVQPEDLTPADIRAKVGAPWIPVDVYTAFLHQIGFTDAEVMHAGGTTWEVRGARQGDLARSEWGTYDRSAGVLFQALLRQGDSTITIRRTGADGSSWVDEEATAAAREQASRLSEAFTDWVWADSERADRLARRYNEQFNNLVLPEYDDGLLTLPGLIDGWTMRPHQNAAVRRILNEPTALLAHVVGAGKTATMVGGAMELRRTGLAKKPAMVVPNHMLNQFSQDFRELYPNAKILAITASDLSKRRRQQFMARIAGGEWDAVIMTHEAFNRVPLHPETQQRYLDREMASIRDQVAAAYEAGMSERTLKQVETAQANAEAKLQQQIAQTSEIGVCLEDTGIDYLFLDEAHEYKNLRTVSAIPGAGIDGSVKATKLHMVLEYLRESTDSGRVATLATGTPIANSVTEAYVLMRYLAPHILDDMHLEAFDNWAATFGEVVSSLEPDPKGDGYKWKARFSRFFNVPELMAAYRTFADVRMAEDLGLPTPTVRSSESGQRGETIVIPPTPAQREFIKDLPRQSWVKEPGGILKALGEGLRGSLDMSLVTSVDTLMYQQDGVENGSKLPDAAEKIAEIWRETRDIVYPVSVDDSTPQDLPGGLQLVFLDEGTPGSTAKHGVDLYADLRGMLTEHGIPREEIRFIHEAANDKKKGELFAAARAGQVKVLIGSTQKMGMGTNVQDRAVALHHLSYPWKPAEMAQREGRVERRGNLAMPEVPGTPDDVRIFYYITQGTFDEFRLNTLTRKAKFIAQLQRRDFNVREIEDIGEDALNLGTLTALASGDPAIVQHVEASAERVRLNRLARTWDRKQDERTQQIQAVDQFLDLATPALEGMRAADQNRVSTAGDAFQMTVDGQTYRTRDSAGAVLGGRLVSLAGDRSLQPGQHVPVGQVGGQDFHAEVSFTAAGRRQLKLRFGWGHVVPTGQRDERAQWQTTSITKDIGRGAVQALERWLTRLDKDAAQLEGEVARQRERRDEAASSLRPKEDNPYRQQARSKEREERLLGKLVVANEKHAAVDEHVQAMGERASDEDREKLDSLTDEVAQLRQSLATEHAFQQQVRDGGHGDQPADIEPGESQGGRPGPPVNEAATRPDGDVLELPDPASGELKAVRARMAAAMEAAHRHGTADAVRANHTGPVIEPSAAHAAETTKADIARHDADAMDGTVDSFPETTPAESAMTEASSAPAGTVPDAAASPVAPESDVPAGQSTYQVAEGQQLPEDTEPVPDAAGYYYAEKDQTVQQESFTEQQPLEPVAVPYEENAAGITEEPGADQTVPAQSAGTDEEQLNLFPVEEAPQPAPLTVEAESATSGATAVDEHTTTTPRTAQTPTAAVADSAPALPENGADTTQATPAALEPQPGAASIEIRHTREGTTVHGTQRDDRPTQIALRRNGFRWSSPQQMWYQRRNTPWGERETFVRNLRQALDQADIPYSLHSPNNENAGPATDNAQPQPHDETVAELPTDPTRADSDVVGPPPTEAPSAAVLGAGIYEETTNLAEPVTTDELTVAQTTDEPAPSGPMTFPQALTSNTSDETPPQNPAINLEVPERPASEKNTAPPAIPSQDEPDDGPDHTEENAMATPTADPQGNSSEQTMRPLPLWPGTGRPPGKWRQEGNVLYDAYDAPMWRLKTATQSQDPGAKPEHVRTRSEAYEPVGVKDALRGVEAAWADIVPADLASADDLREDLEENLNDLEQQWQQAVPRQGTGSIAAAPETDPERDGPEADSAEAVNAALQQADTHTGVLRHLTEWQQLQRLREATVSLWETIKQKAGDYWTQLQGDSRFQGFWRAIGIRTCEKIADWARAGAEKLQASGPGIPSAEALHKLSDTALVYSSPARQTPPTDPPVAAQEENLNVRQPRMATESGGPLPYSSREEATRDVQALAGAFRSWMATSMGRELRESTNPWVREFRESWKNLPPPTLPDGPGPAASPFGVVAEKAKAVYDRAVQADRFTATDLTALRTFVEGANLVAGRLAVTLPPGVVSTPRTPQQTPPAPQVAVPQETPAAAGTRRSA